MLRFFRALRQRLLAENRLSQYLLYAVGEIVLVVIGILIALQINTWNEERKFRAQQFGLLKDLEADLEANQRELENGRKVNRHFLEEYQGLARAIREDHPPSRAIDSLCRHLANWHSPYFTRTAYESLKNKGLEIIRNDSLKKQIVALYEKEFVFLSEDYDRTEWEFASNIKTQLLNPYIQYGEQIRSTELDLVQYEVLPVDFQRMKQDQPFINMLSELIVYRSRGVVQYTQTIASIQVVRQSIQEELENLRP